MFLLVFAKNHSTGDITKSAAIDLAKFKLRINIIQVNCEDIASN